MGDSSGETTPRRCYPHATVKSRARPFRRDSVASFQAADDKEEEKNALDGGQCEPKEVLSPANTVETNKKRHRRSLGADGTTRKRSRPESTSFDGAPDEDENLKQVYYSSMEEANDAMMQSAVITLQEVWACIIQGIEIGAQWPSSFDHITSPLKTLASSVASLFFSGYEGYVVDLLVKKAEQLVCFDFSSALPSRLPQDSVPSSIRRGTKLRRSSSSSSYSSASHVQCEGEDGCTSGSDDNNKGSSRRKRRRTPSPPSSPLDRTGSTVCPSVTHHQLPVAPSTSPAGLPTGVWYDRVEHRYVVQCNETTRCGRKKRRYFGVSRYGNENARTLAVNARLQILGILNKDDSPTSCSPPTSLISTTSSEICKKDLNFSSRPASTLFCASQDQSPPSCRRGESSEPPLAYSSTTLSLPVKTDPSVSSFPVRGVQSNNSGASFSPQCVGKPIFPSSSPLPQDELPDSSRGGDTMTSSSPDAALGALLLQILSLATVNASATSSLHTCEEVTSSSDSYMSAATTACTTPAGGVPPTISFDTLNTPSTGAASDTEDDETDSFDEKEEKGPPSSVVNAVAEALATALSALTTPTEGAADAPPIFSPPESLTPVPPPPLPLSQLPVLPGGSGGEGEEGVRCQGVRFDAVKNRWLAVCFDPEKQRTVKRSFAVAKYGPHKARDLAISARRNAQMKKHSHLAHQQRLHSIVAGQKINDEAAAIYSNNFITFPGSALTSPFALPSVVTQPSAFYRRGGGDVQCRGSSVKEEPKSP